MTNVWKSFGTASRPLYQRVLGYALITAIAVLIVYFVLPAGWALLGLPSGVGALLVLLAVAGGFGGILYSAKAGALTVPRWTDRNHLELGIAGDLLFGIAGGLLLFVVVPGRLQLDQREDAIKLIGLAIVLGYAGRGIVDSAANAQISAIRRKTDRLEQTETATALLAEFLEPRTDDTPELRQRVAQALKAAPASSWAALFRDAELVRERFWKEAARAVRGDATAEMRAVQLLDRSRFVFETLYNAGGKQDHRILASIGYVYRDLAQPEQAVPMLRDAIELAAAAHDRQHAHYHFALALALIELRSKQGGKVSALDPTLGDEVQPELNLAMKLEPAIAELVKKVAASETLPVYDRALQQYLRQ